jgi:hypothetical protein
MSIILDNDIYFALPSMSFVFLRLDYLSYSILERMLEYKQLSKLPAVLAYHKVQYKQDKVVKGVKTTKISYNVNSQKLIFLSFRCKCSQSLKLWFFLIISLQCYI